MWKGSGPAGVPSCGFVLCCSVSSSGFLCRTSSWGRDGGYAEGPGGILEDCGVSYTAVGRLPVCNAASGNSVNQASKLASLTRAKKGLSMVCRRSIVYCIFLSTCHIYYDCFPSHISTTAHLPLHAHFRAWISPPCLSLSSLSFPSGSPTTVSPLHVLNAITLNPEP